MQKMANFREGEMVKFSWNPSYKYIKERGSTGVATTVTSMCDGA